MYVARFLLCNLSSGLTGIRHKLILAVCTYSKTVNLFFIMRQGDDGRFGTILAELIHVFA